MTYIIVTNDDGVLAPGILALAQAMREIGRINVIAPSINQSAGGHKKTLFTDITVDQVNLEDGTGAYSIGGSPADCVALAQMGVVEWPPRLVVSGINRGGNMGQDVTYSGTVTAALESVIHAVPAIAFSLDNRHATTVEDYRDAARAAAAIVRLVLTKALPAFTVLNVNVPLQAPYKGIRITRQGVRIYRDEPLVEENRWRIVGEEPTGNYEEEGTDLWAVHNGYISVTPLHLDMTAHRFISELSAWDLAL